MIVTCCVETVKLRWAGDASSLPARSRALTAKACDPGASPDSVAVVDSLNAPKGPPSRLQANASPVAGERLSSPTKLNVAPVEVIVPLGAVREIRLSVPGPEQALGFAGAETA